MFLKEVSINKFKVLEKIHLKFDNTFTPTIYPVASLNGGGKSTFLQIIFILLYTSFSTDKDKLQFLRNILNNVSITNADFEEFIKLKIIINNEEHTIEFFLANNSFANFQSIVTFNELEDEFINGKYQKAIEQILEIKHMVTENGDYKRYRQSMTLRRKLNDLIADASFHHRDLLLRYQESDKYEDFDFLLNELESYFEDKLYDLKLYLEEMEEQKNKTNNFLKEKNLNYSVNCNKNSYLVFKTDLKIEQLQELSKKVFLVAPSTQIFSFLSHDAKKTLFLSQEVKSNIFDSKHLYDYHVHTSKEFLQNFFTYEFASTSLIISSFKIARDKDFEEAVETSKYGNNLERLKDDLDNFLLNKTITVDKNLTRVIFKIKDSKKELEPEDLSHGELKKLGLFIWLKYKNLDDSLILMDEVENGLHPDWQYSIINDLKKWSPSNQYILATHSYEICEALTPSHISELNPKLLK
ncbi:AAA family ATPase [Aliarcobacter butzleri]|uniref:AAA family ATPase n=1 Tax=Aliarcobacter butzleri TaxID=28197 RepID=UPI00345087F3